MPLKVGYCAKVVEIKSSTEKSTTCRISTTNKGKEDYKGFAMLIGDAHEKAVDISSGTEIKVGDFFVTTNASNGKYYTNVTITDLEIVGDSHDNEEIGLPFS